MVTFIGDTTMNFFKKSPLFVAMALGKLGVIEGGSGGCGCHKHKDREQQGISTGSDGTDIDNQS